MSSLGYLICFYITCCREVKQEANVLENVKCTEPSECENPSGRTFRVDWENPIRATAGGRVEMAAVFDLGDNVGLLISSLIN